MFAWKVILGVVLNMGIFGLLLFVPAGTVHWWQAWVFLGVVGLGTVVTMVAIFRHAPELLRERLRFPLQKEQPFADKVVLMFFLASFYALEIFIPLDVFRWQLLGRCGTAVAVLGLVLFGVGWWIISLAFHANAFAATVVKLQEERHQYVVDTGVYAVVRHPMYAGAVLVALGMPLWLGSYAATLAALVPLAIMIVRIFIEERFLREKLPGYEAYMQKVRYRLIPHVW